MSWVILLMIFWTFYPRTNIFSMDQRFIVDFKQGDCYVTVLGFSADIPALPRFCCFLPHLTHSLMLLPALDFLDPIFPSPIFFWILNFHWTKKNAATNPKNNWIYILTRVKVSTYDLCLGGSSLVCQRVFITGDLDKN